MSRQGREQVSWLQKRKKLWPIMVRTFWLLCIPHLPRMQCTFQLTLSPSMFTELSESQVSTVASCSLKHEESDLQVLDMDQADTAKCARPRPLSVRQLVLRRGLTLLVMVLILAAGILIYKVLQTSNEWYCSSWYCNSTPVFSSY